MDDIQSTILYDPNKAFHLKWLNIEFSSRCNLRCKWCSLNHNKTEAFIPEEILTKLFDEISTDSRFKLDCIDLHNAGEILLDKQLEGKLKIISNYEKIAPVNMLTNATLLTPVVSEIILSSKAIDLIRFSVDGGSPEQFERIRKGAKWHIVKENITHFIQLNKGAIQTGIICIVPENYALSMDWMAQEFLDLLALVDNVELRYPHNWDGRKELGLHSAENPHTNKKICKFLKKNLVVLPNGDVTVCCADLNSKGVLGNIKDHNLADIYLSIERASMIENFLLDKKHKIYLCEKCSGYYE